MINYEPYIDQKHLILLGQYNGNYYIQDVASLDEFGGYYHESYITNVNKIIKSGYGGNRPSRSDCHPNIWK